MILLPVHPFDRYRPLVDDWAGFQDALSRPLPVCIWANVLRTGPEAVHAWLDRKGIPAEPLRWYPGAFRLPSDGKAGSLLPYRTGHIHIQEEVSLLPVKLLDPQPGERVLDLCAAPGGKTAQMALAMGNTGTVIANDRSRGRLNVLRRLLARLGAANVTTTCYDAARFPGEPEQYDRVLLDAPCSCEGTSRKNPGVADLSGREQACRMGGAQKAMLRRAVRLCRPGGRIVYSTCTYAPEENEAVVDAVLREHAGEVRVLPAVVEHLAHAPGLTSWQGQAYDPSLAGAVRVWPHQNDSGGFFAAILEKSPSSTDHIPGPAPLLPRSPHDHFLGALREHFGLAADAFDGFALTEPNPKYLSIVSGDHAVPRELQAEGTGLVFLRLKPTYPKLTTAAAMTFGAGATRNVIVLERARAEDFLNKLDMAVTPEEASACGPTVYVIVRHEQFVLGLGLLRKKEDGGVLESLVPGAWASS